MAYFDPKELAEAIRNEFIAEDDTGRCSKILKPIARKAKPGGLPLNFRSSKVDSSSSSSEEHSPCYLATADCKSTFELIQERLRARFLENDLSAIVDEGEWKFFDNSQMDMDESVPDSDLFHYKDISSPTKASTPARKSVTTELISKTDFVVRPDLAAYARFAASGIDMGRKLLVFYPFSEADNEKQGRFSLIFYARQQTRISDLIGLCCYQYAKARRTNDIGNVSQYYLLMAEESGEVDRDLPTVDGHRLLSELGSCWSTIALMKRNTPADSNLTLTKIIVYTVNGGRYEFPVESLDMSLRWLRDQALQKRIEDEGRDFLSDCPALQEYVLETVRGRDIALDLDKPISSTACLEFLLLRVNSSRGDFIPVSHSLSAEKRSSTAKKRSSSTNSSPVQRPRYIELNRRDSTPVFDFNDSHDVIDDVYTVERLHRYKPKWTALLTIRSDRIEITPNQMEQNKKRNSIFMNSPHKKLSLTWNRIGGIEIVDRTNATKRVVRIVWLTELKSKNDLEISAVSGFADVRRVSSMSTESDCSLRSDELSRRKLIIDGHWKTVQLEADVDDAWKIAEKVSTAIENRNSEVHQIYKFSNGGTKKPKEAALEAFGASAGLILKERKISLSPAVKGVSRLTSTVASAVPTLQKLLLRHD